MAKLDYGLTRSLAPLASDGVVHRCGYLLDPSQHRPARRSTNENNCDSTSIP